MNTNTSHCAGAAPLRRPSMGCLPSLAAVKRLTGAMLTAAVVVSAALPAYGADSLSTARPEQVGMSSERLQRITELTQRYVDEGKLAGAVTLVARQGKVVYFDAVGKADLESGAAMENDTLVRIYSMSKPITAVAAMMLYEEGAFQLTDPVSKFLPELADLTVLTEDGERVPAETMTMQHLLSHTAGFSYGFDSRDPVDKLYNEVAPLESRDLDEFVERMAQLPLKYQPGTKWHYSVAVDVTGAVVERISGQPFDQFLAERLFQPLGMEDTFFAVPDAKDERFGTNHRYDEEAGELEVLPVPDYPLWKDTTFFSGGGGLVSTAEDYARFCEMLRAGGIFNGKRLLSPKTVELMTMNHLPALLPPAAPGQAPAGLSVGERTGSGFGLGFAVVTDVPATGVISSEGEYSWGGAAGTIFWIDPVEDLYVVSMIQLMGSPWPLRAELKALTYGALTDQD